MLFDLIISPIETVVDWVFLFITDKLPFIGVPGAIIGVSIVINFLALPLYNVADAIKDREREIQLKLESKTARIKKFFKGDERFMMMQTMYRQNHYHPFYSLRSSLSILIEIPFFIAAYHYLSHNEILQASNIDFGFITLNLGAPDHIFKTGPFFINILPIAMTLINVVSSMIYSKGAPKKELIQLYGLSLVFLVLLYESPSGLVIYWICNNIFSLLKNVFQKSKWSKYASGFIYAVFAFVILLLACAISSRNNVSAEHLVVVWGAFIIFILSPFFAFKVFKNQTVKVLNKIDELSENNYSSIFYAGCAGLSLFMGFVLSSSVIATSPIEFSCLGNTDSPFNYVVSTFCFFMGLCFFWPAVIYNLFSKKVKFFLSMIIFVLFVSALANVYLFSYQYGNISQTFAFETDKVFRNKGIFYLAAPLCLAVFSLILFLLQKNKRIKSITTSLLIILCLAETCLGIYKSDFIIKKWNANKENLLEAKHSGKSRIESIYSLADEKSGKKNVIVFFLDRGINSFIPKFLRHYPKLEKSFDGFTWYKNTLSFGNFTTVGAPAMCGGYEYTPEKINERSGELLRDKHNEASLVMPKLFLDAGWSVTVTDPPLPNYSEKTDLSAFKKYPQIKVSELAGKFDANYVELFGGSGRELDKICKKQARNFCIIQCLFPPLRLNFYNIVKDAVNETSFEHYYSSLYFINELTDFNSTNNNFFFIENDATHPDSDAPDWGKDGHLLIPEEEIKVYYDFKDSKDLVHYRVNALCIKEVAKWLDYLKENNAYDNSRIIIVSDHGRGIHLEDFNGFAEYEAPAFFSALLLYKDFNSRGRVKTDGTFMMNADTPFLAKEGLGLSSKNPFTQKELVQEKDGEVHLHYAETTSTTKIYNNRKFDLKKTKGWAVRDNIFDEKNWRRLD